MCPVNDSAQMTRPSEQAFPGRFPSNPGPAVKTNEAPTGIPGQGLIHLLLRLDLNQ